MKYAVLLSMFFSLSVLANGTDKALRKTFQIIDEINGQTFDYFGCDSNDPNAPEYCKDLYKYVCSMKKQTNKQGELDNELNGKYWNVLSKNCTHKQFNDTVKVTHQRSEESVYKITNVMRDDVRNAFSDAKTALYQFISSTSLIKKEHVSTMLQKVSSVGLLYGKEYVERLVFQGKKQAPGMSEEELRVHANKLYMSACGMNGMEVNAFFDSGSLVLCPGLLISMSDYGGKKDELLSALRFTIGHEIGHAIDASAYPDVYNDMQTCYKDVAKNDTVWQPDTAAEITADYWGAIAMATPIKKNLYSKKLDPNDPEKNARIIAYSVDGFCRPPTESGAPHPEGAFRVNQTIGKHPYIARALNCEPAQEDAPYCSLKGAYSN
ncbi:MAG: hypothetical protein ACLGHN_08805 [Bacteriovoracia bacterium]